MKVNVRRRRRCQVEDDNDVQCTNKMTHKEEDQDGMCSRCADMLWNWLKHDTPVIFKKVDHDS